MTGACRRRPSLVVTALVVRALVVVALLTGMAATCSRIDEPPAKEARRPPPTGTPGVSGTGTVPLENLPVDAAGAQAIVETYLHGLYDGNPEAQKKVATAWAFELGLVHTSRQDERERQRAAAAATTTIAPTTVADPAVPPPTAPPGATTTAPPIPEPTTTTTSSPPPAVTITGQITGVHGIPEAIVATGELVVTAPRPLPALIGTTVTTAPASVADTHTITFSDFLLRATGKRGVVVADFTAKPSDGYGPLSGRLSDQIAFRDGNQVVADDVVVMMQTALRSAGEGDRTVQVDLTFDHKGSAATTVDPDGVKLTIDGTESAPGIAHVFVPPILPGRRTEGYLLVKQPAAMADGRPVAGGTIEFRLKAGDTVVPVKLATPPFPAEF